MGQAMTTDESTELNISFKQTRSTGARGQAANAEVNEDDLIPALTPDVCEEIVRLLGGRGGAEMGQDDDEKPTVVFTRPRWWRRRKKVLSGRRQKQLGALLNNCLETPAGQAEVKRKLLAAGVADGQATDSE